MINFSHNNLNIALSPYLRQHQENPIFWQEWSKEVLEYARNKRKILFVSVGYATCHWCHVMAHEAFSNNHVADYLNAHFVSIKIDKEQRPDLDHYFMAFLQQTTGSGGWPLNIFLTPDGKPILAMTYVPESHFLDILHDVQAFYRESGDSIRPFVMKFSPSASLTEENAVNSLLSSFAEHLQFGPQFPPHASLLFLLSFWEYTSDSVLRLKIQKIIFELLDTMATRGLHDHLQGGFFRYCVDGEWTIPHFEKMLYDQAMLLWVYGAAYKLFSRDKDKKIIEKLVSCLNETFLCDGLFYSAHDADTNHHEGITYLWTREELIKILSPPEFALFSSLYDLKTTIEGNIHLLKRENLFLPEIEKKLLAVRKKREQSDVDRKYVTSWNALVGIGLMMAYRALGDSAFQQKAFTLFNTILAQHDLQGKLAHSSIKGQRQSGEFLEDYASMLLFATYLYEDNGVDKEIVRKWVVRVLPFKQGRWIENITDDFAPLPAATFDHPTPSSLSLAEMALVRAQIILGEEYSSGVFQEPRQSDFFNLQVLLRNGAGHVISTPEKIDWHHLPLNSLQVRSDGIQDCYRGQCQQFKTVGELLQGLKRK